MRKSILCTCAVVAIAVLAGIGNTKAPPVRINVSPDTKGLRLREDFPGGYQLATRGNTSVILHRRKRWVATALFVANLVISGINMIIGAQQARMQRMILEQMARHHRAKTRFQLETVCMAICVTEWTHWSACSEPCGGGTRVRTRETNIIGMCNEIEDFHCPHTMLRQEAYCNYGCYHGGRVLGQGVCNCLDGYGGKCCQTELRCPHPGNPRNGDVRAVSFPVQYGGLALFACDQGFYMDGGDALVCNPNGTWNGHPPHCRRLVCTMPIVQPHVEILNPQAEYYYEDTLYYACEEGYELVGPEVRTCQRVSATDERGRFSAFDPLCTEISCPDPGTPLYGSRDSDDLTFGSEIGFTCEDGFKLLGQTSIRCLATGEWYGKAPTCEQLPCDPPYVPTNARVRVGRTPVSGTTATYTCDPGFILEGNTILTCQPSGFWDLIEPECRASDCGDPGTPENGARDGSIFYYPYSVKFICFAGFELRGFTNITCQETGTWNGIAPQCDACPIGMYMPPVGHSCVSCPANMHTTIEGSTSVNQCICDHGYRGPPGGPCEEIRCPALSPPENGELAPCDHVLDSECVASCHPGYILEFGSSARTCQRDGTWTGRPPVCNGCPMDTYKSDEQSCRPCPQFSFTNFEVAVREIDGCVCVPGYEGPGGGPCLDVNECEIEGGPCEDTCENRPGGYTCHCLTPGYALAEDGHSCYAERQCRNLTETDAPQDGGLVCHWYPIHNSQQCQVRCNDGYEFPARTNDYEYCGPPTGYTWSYQVVDPTAIIEPCIEEFFEGFRMEADSSYFVRACNDLTPEEQDETKREFAAILNENGVCSRNNTAVCEIANMGIVCGRTTQRRRRRGVLEEVQSIEMLFNVTALQIETQTKNCDSICVMIGIPMDECDEYCVPAYKRYLQAGVMHAKATLEAIYADPDRLQSLMFHAAGREFEPDSFSSTEPGVDCAPGMRHVGSVCIPCDSGTYYDEESNSCMQCPVGTYQILPQQEACEPCPDGSVALLEGSVLCKACDPGFYGPGCELICDCINGICEPTTGDCICHTGWEGQRCDIDIDGCRSAECYPGVMCSDVPAPGSGYQCGACPAGRSGDGRVCSPV